MGLVPYLHQSFQLTMLRYQGVKINVKRLQSTCPTSSLRIGLVLSRTGPGNSPEGSLSIEIWVMRFNSDVSVSIQIIIDRNDSV